MRVSATAARRPSGVSVGMLGIRRRPRSVARIWNESPLSVGFLEACAPARVQAGIGAAGVQQILVAALLDEAATLDHQHEVGVLGGGEAVGDRDGGAARREPVDGL